MSTLRKRGEVWYADITDPVNGKRKQKSLGTKDIATARIYLRELEKQLAITPFVDSEETTWEEAFRILKEDPTKNRAEATIAFYKTKACVLLRVFGEKCYLQDITRDKVVEFIKQRKVDGVAQYTIKKEVDLLKQMLWALKREGLITFDPRDVIPRLETGYKPKKDHLTIEQCDRLLEALPEARGSHVAFMIATGARLGESLRARKADIDLENNFVFMRGTKTATAKATIPVVLKKHQEYLKMAFDCAPADSPMFHKWKNLYRDIGEVCRKIDIPRVTANTLRHTQTQHLLDSGATLEQAAQVARHASTQMVYAVYGKPDAESLAKRIKKSIGA